MPIKVDIVDNSSVVKVKPKSNDEIKAKNGCNSTANFLQYEIDQKQDKIEFITIVGPSLTGVLTQEELDALKSYVNKIVVGKAIYRLSIVEGNIRKYFTSSEITEFNEINVNMETGEYSIVNKMNPIIQQHIENDIIHITEEERLYWNNKVSANVKQNTGFETDYNLLLEK